MQMTDSTKSILPRRQNPWRKLALLAALALSVPALAGSPTGTAAVAPTADNVTSIQGERMMAFAKSSVGVLNKWTQKVANDGLMTPGEARAWARQALAAFSSFTPDQLRLAQMATERWEIDLLISAAPFAVGTSWALARQLDRPDISPITDSALTGKDNQKLGTLSTEDLVFTPLTPCRIADSRAVYGGPGPLANLATRQIGSGSGYANFAFQGGSATTNCGMGNMGSDDNAVLVLSVSTFSQTGAGYITLFRVGDTNPAPLAVSQWFQGAVVNTSTVFVGTDCCFNKDFNIYVNGASTDYAIDVVGYFARPIATALECVTTAEATAVVPAASTFTLNAPACAAGYTKVSAGCRSGNFNSTTRATVNELSDCQGYNFSGAAENQYATARCCRVPGR